MSPPWSPWEEGVTEVTGDTLRCSLWYRKKGESEQASKRVARVLKTFREGPELELWESGRSFTSRDRLTQAGLQGCGGKGGLDHFGCCGHREANDVTTHLSLTQATEPAVNWETDGLAHGAWSLAVEVATDIRAGSQQEGQVTLV